MANSGEITGVRQYLASLPDMSVMGVAELREVYDQAGLSVPVPEGVAIEPASAGGVPGIWAKPAGARDGAAMLYLHGGGYIIGSTNSHRHMVAAIAKAAAVNVLALDYRLGPESAFPAALEDAIAGYQHLLGLGIPASQLTIGGDSAGGGLTIAVLLALRDRSIPLPAAAVCLSPWVDLTATAGTYTTKAAVDPICNLKQITDMANGYLQGQDAKAPYASPLFADLQGLPPLLVHVGTEEVLLDDSLQFTGRARQAGVNVTLEVWDEMIHVWHFFFAALREGREAIEGIGKFVRARTASAATAA